LKEAKSAAFFKRALIKSLTIDSLIFSMERKYAEYLLEKTLTDYNLLAEDFARSRDFIPDDIRKLAGYIKENDKVLDSGCGNGRFYELTKEKKADYYGIDFSEKLIEICQKKYPLARFQKAGGFQLPFPDNFFDKVFSISVLHHIPSKELQTKFLEESKRVLKPGGLLVIRVWDFWKRRIFPKLFIKHAFLKIAGKSKLDFKDVFWVWKDSAGKSSVERYFHCFTKRELEKLTRKTGFRIKKSWRSGKSPRTNIYLIAEK